MIIVAIIQGSICLLIAIRWIYYSKCNTLASVKPGRRGEKKMRVD